MITTAPFDSRGYVVGETIGVQITFSEPVMVSGTPRLRLGFGEDLVDAEWDEEASDGASVVFRRAGGAVAERLAQVLRNVDRHREPALHLP